MAIHMQIAWNLVYFDQHSHQRIAGRVFVDLYFRMDLVQESIHQG